MLGMKLLENGQSDGEIFFEPSSSIARYSNGLPKIVPIISDDLPSYDSTTHKVVMTESLDGEVWKRHWSVVELSSDELHAQIIVQLQRSDYDVIRGIDDLAAILVAAGYTLPTELAEKLAARANLRSQLS